MKKVVATMMAVLLISVSSLSYASATNVTIMASNYLSMYGAWIEPVDSGSFDVAFLVNGTRTMAYIGASKIVVQRKIGSTWYDVSTYTKENTSNLIATDTSLKVGSVYFSGVSGATYRAVVSVYAADANGYDTRTVTSETIIA